MDTRGGTRISAKGRRNTALAIAFVLALAVSVLWAPEGSASLPGASTDAAGQDFLEALAELPVDLDGDGVSTLGDKLAFSMNWLFAGGPPPPAPNPDCGPDPTDDPIGCLKYRPQHCQ